MQRSVFQEGDVIFRSGDPSDYAYLIVSGSVEVRLPKGHSTVLKPGEVFGEMGLVDPRPRSATVMAKEYTVCAAYSEDELLEAIRNTPEEAITLIRALIKRLRKANES